ncbi:hypothetical protein [Gluconobacter kanchanaburiensis]|uniref:Aminotransferase class V domain-containing protein n=1 Tax=Gluconobacter kanchanaburiensis NBRC 103587 TaxID=1307948 RepID=A0A511B523_9PROT|nr:hypothetical protein [Gluconobacter kanchanaburiensis]MBF0861947.1 hypothetical protein [Gluconobacter kanchanaburiensis]GBR67748.1 hypothetical protein AA103587_0446 [Gluconobacter kanchanaburiensis NBRC 103587]GEK95526.1 hypothetical protein GKA01_07230 [Gluconobacter kanchanaburiensis NBRC 103587]
MLADTLTRSLTDVLERPDLRVIADGVVPVLDVSLSLPFRITGSLKPGLPFSMQTATLTLGGPCLEAPRLAPTFLRHAIELMRLLEPGANPYLASFAAARVAALFHALDTDEVVPLPAWLGLFSDEVPQASDLCACWTVLSAFLPELPEFTSQEAERLQGVLARLWPVLAPAETLMSGGGDSRLAVDPRTGLNRYSSSHRPRPWAITFGSSTASSLSERGFGGAEAARRGMMNALLAKQDPDLVQEGVVRRARAAIGAHYGLPEDAVLLSASGTDCELAVLALVAAGTDRPVTSILLAPDETGSGVPLAACGRHFATDSACATLVGKGEVIEGFSPETRLIGVDIREPDGTARPVAAINAQCRDLAEREVAEGRHVLLHRLDQSKTGLAAPDMDLVGELCSRLGDQLSIVVDVCQARLSPSRVAEWVGRGIIVMITGSKFFTGPPFCGAILLPPEIRRRLPFLSLPRGLRAYGNRDEWPDGADASALNDGHNIGLALRWYAALAEMDALFALSDPVIRSRLTRFMTEAVAMVKARPALTMLPMGTPFDDGRWDAVPTILSFLVDAPHAPGRPLALEDARRLHRWLNADLSPWVAEGEGSLLCVLGQPVPVPHPLLEGPAGALRLCAGARLVSGEPSHEGLDEERRLQRECMDARRVLGKLELILKHWDVLLDANPVPRYAPLS